MTTTDLVGLRIKTVRRQRGLSQAQLAHPELSDSYISLIESGKRTPTPAVLELLAQKLDCSLSYLLNGVTAEQMEDLELALGYAQLALENGEAREARTRFLELMADNNLTGLATLRQAVEFGLARAHEACGDLEQAVAVLRRLREDDLPAERRIEVAIALSRVYRVGGRLSEAVEVAEGMLTSASRPAWTDGLVELGATLLAAYLERGDLLRSRQFAAELLDAADALGTPRAIVAANWNAAYAALWTQHGEDALTFAERAIAVQEENGAARNTARMQVTLAHLYLGVRPGEIGRARELLARAAQTMAETSASSFEQTNARLEQARAEIIGGDLDRALQFVTDVERHLPEMASRSVVEMHLLRSRILTLRSEGEQAGAELRAARERIDELSGGTYGLASWYAVAESYELLGDSDNSVDAYQRALAAAGL
ncbi:helix-turn-helix domain-containing protein [Nonomuraea sp. NPDC050310]|uniref:helix-turn-helix domain-containing protein n=1 Tax=unclassified Nonomuraea TaxID=2593643 RepID=UPI0033C4AE06